MSDARAQLLSRLVDEVAANGLTDRSLRELATAAGTSHRMVLYHFGSREGLVAAIVDEIEARQRAAMRELAARCETAAELVRAMWQRVSAPEMRPFVRLFFESLAATARAGDRSLTEPWLEDALAVARLLGAPGDQAELRLGIAVTRGLLIDVIAGGDVDAATESLERFVAMWEAAGRQSTVE
jgi:AcrR family transcriptional regulator